MAKRDLLKCELQISPKELAISKLLNPKPKFEMPQSQLLQSLKQFLPQIQSENEKLKDEKYLKQIQMEDQNQLERVKITDVIPQKSKHQIRKQFRRTGIHKDKRFINMDLYMGVFDLKEPKQQNTPLIQEL